MLDGQPCDGYRVVKDGVEGTGTFSLPREAIDEEVRPSGEDVVAWLTGL